MNIETNNINLSKEPQINKTKPSENNDSSTKFADELKKGAVEEKNEVKEERFEEVKEKTKINGNGSEKENLTDSKNLESKKEIDKALEGLNSVVKELNQSEDKFSNSMQNKESFADKNNVINNDFNIQENKELLPQMNPNMNFSGNGQPFSSFMNNDSNQNNNNSLKSSAQELAEEAAILSTMAENIAIANRNQALKDSRTITNEEGIKNVDSTTGIKIENIVKFDNIVMNQADVEVFVNLVENKEVNLNNLSTNSIEKSLQVSKTLSDLLAKSMEKNQPVRIDFDNNISVIIRISKDGKIAADFLPSSQVAEAYLRENLPILRQKFNENNIEYDSLNQRERRDSNKDNNKKKDRNHE